MNLPRDPAAGFNQLRFLGVADVYKAGVLAGHLSREPGSMVSFTYTAEYLARAETSFPAVATTLPRTGSPVVSTGGALPAFFAGLLPEGHRLTVLRAAVKTSLNDELTLLLAVGGDVPGDVQVVPHDTPAASPRPAAHINDHLDFDELADALDLHSLPGVHNKVSASMLSAPLSLRDGRYILKLESPEYPALLTNEAAHLVAARALKIPVAQARLLTDFAGRRALLVTRFDRERDPSGGWTRLPLEDATQVLNLPPAAKYQISTEAAITALATLCAARPVAIRNLYLQFVYAWLTGNGDLHAKNISVLANAGGTWKISPVYDVPCTLLYGDDTVALSIAGKTKNIKARHFAELAAAIGLPAKAATAAHARALSAANAVNLETLGITGSPLNGALRELSFRRRELAE